MSEEEAKAKEEATGSGKTAVLKLNPMVAEEYLFQKLPQQVMEDGKIEGIIKELQKLESGPARAMAIVHIMMKQNLAKPLGQIIPPQSGAKIVKDRIVQSATILLGMLRDEVERLEVEILQSKKEGKEYEVRGNVKKMIQLHLDVILAVREIMNRYLILYAINLPPEYRPPLAQVKLGIEVIAT